MLEGKPVHFGVMQEAQHMWTSLVRTPMRTGQCPLDVGTSLITLLSPEGSQDLVTMSVGRRSPSGKHQHTDIEYVSQEKEVTKEA